MQIGIRRRTRALGSTMDMAGMAPPRPRGESFDRSSTTSFGMRLDERRYIQAMDQRRTVDAPNRGFKEEVLTAVSRNPLSQVGRTAGVDMVHRDPRGGPFFLMDPRHRSTTEDRVSVVLPRSASTAKPWTGCSS